MTQFLYFLLSAFLITGSAYAKSADIPMGGGHDNHAPIEVTSDSLEVLQQENRAVFSGHVVVVQGNVRLKANDMIVYYAAKAPAKDKKPAKNDKSLGGSNGNIQKIDAKGDVFLSTDEETASGASATYDVENHRILLNDHVVLTRGQNTLKGDKLVYNFDTGKSVLTSGAGTVGADGKKERVRALFIPENNDKVKP